MDKSGPISAEHPIITGDYAVYTPPISEMVDTINRWVDQQVTGAYIYGASRFGKSRGVQYFVCDALREKFGDIAPLVVWLRRADSQLSEASFWHALLLAGKFAFADPLKPPSRTKGQYLVYEMFVTLARSARSNQVVLLIDEAHDMTHKEWKWLVGLQNALDWEHYRLSVISVGSHQLNFQPTSLGIAGNAHVAARFMMAHERFRGIRSVEESAFVLNGFDVDSEWPPGSGLSFLQYFAEDDFRQGRRLAQCAGDLWKALQDLNPPGKVKASEFPMWQIATVAEDMLKALASGEEWEKVVSYKNILLLLRRTGFSSHMENISRP
ncbi:ATP-binding protein [Rugamonas sp. FT107W]|uniref:ATP-binding protein n=1 Tax=Duganella vulcania TaxID=2692166 RepID=A0A845HDF1_9BURK|nr:ATP-binding protein [Duganella vulcania]MYN16791.1 ATP-binding protein [Duganella vulcania]